MGPEEILDVARVLEFSPCRVILGPRGRDIEKVAGDMEGLRGIILLLADRVTSRSLDVFSGLRFVAEGGAVAQMGERIPRTDEASGSTPLCSTIITLKPSTPSTRC